jgi:hypothetical protein
MFHEMRTAKRFHLMKMKSYCAFTTTETTAGFFEWLNFRSGLISQPRGIRYKVSHLDSGSRFLRSRLSGTLYNPDRLLEIIRLEIKVVWRWSLTGFERVGHVVW